VGIRENSSMLLQAKLADFFIMDIFTTTTKFPKILTSQHQDELVQVTVETKPLNGRSDLFVDARMARTDIIINVPLLQQILAFFVLPSEQASTNTTSTTKHHSPPPSTKEIHLMINAPVFIVPLDYTNLSTPLLRIDLGQFALESDLTPSDHYDKYHVRLHGIGVSLDQMILEQVDINLDIETCKLVDQIEHASTRIMGSIPRICINLSPGELRSMIKVINHVMELLDNPTGSDDMRLTYQGLLTIVKGQEYLPSRGNIID
jgi:hypothetical protein